MNDPSAPIPHRSPGIGPPCPRCRKAMTQRDGPRGAFWGCVRYPRCDATLSLDNDPFPAHILQAVAAIRRTRYRRFVCEIWRGVQRGKALDAALIGAVQIAFRRPTEYEARLRKAVALLNDSEVSAALRACGFEEEPFR